MAMQLGQTVFKVDYNKVEALAKLQLSKHQIGLRLGFKSKTWYRYCDQDPEIQEAMDRGYAAICDVLSANLMICAVEQKDTAMMLRLLEKFSPRFAPGPTHLHLTGGVQDPNGDIPALIGPIDLDAARRISEAFLQTHRPSNAVRIDIDSEDLDD